MKRTVQIKTIVLALFGAGLVSLPFQATANPTGGQIVAGNATIRQETATKVGVTQTTDKAIIDWQKYSIGANEHVQYYQPSANSVSLNRVVGQDPSQILGRLTANGQVFLVNPNGIYFGKNAQIDVAGLVASTHNIRNEDFMAGKHLFNIPGKPGASVINEGTIRIADTGIAAFVAPSVANRGIVAAKLGKVAMAAANGFTLDFTGDNLLSFMVNDAVAQTAFDLEGKPLTSFVENSGKIEAQGGYVLLTAKAAENAIHGVINHSGVIEAQTVNQKDGEIILHAGKGSLEVSGTLDASAANGGNGGFIETSGGKVSVTDSARITTTAPFGKTGTWLIDPNDYTIAASGGNMTGATLSRNLASNNVTIATALMGTSGGNGDIFVNDAISWSSANRLYLNAERNVTINGRVSASNSSATFQVTSPGLLRIANTGSVLAGLVNYSLGNATLLGTTTATGDRLYIGAYGGKALRIESSPTSGVLSLTPSEIANLRVTRSGGDLNLQSTQSITVATELTGAEIVADNFSLHTQGDLTIDAPLGNVATNSPFLIQKFHGMAFGNLNVTANGFVGANLVSYRGDRINLVGRTTAGNAGISVGPASASRDIYVVNNSGSVSGSAGVELSRAELATLSAAESANINIGHSSPSITRGDVIVEASLDSSHVRSPNDLHFYGRDIYISSGGIDLSGGHSWLRISADRNIQFTAPVKAEGIYLTNGDLGRISQQGNGTLTADHLLVTGKGGDLDDISTGNSIGMVAANVTGTFWLNNGSRSLTIGSLGGVDGVRAGNIGIVTTGTLTLDLPLQATGTGDVSVGATTTRDSLCNTGPCVRPHIELHAGSGFINNAGANPLSVQPGKFWMVATNKRSTTTFNGWVVPDDLVTYDAGSIQGNLLLSRNRFIYAAKDPQEDTKPDPCKNMPIGCGGEKLKDPPKPPVLPDPNVVIPPGVDKDWYLQAIKFGLDQTKAIAVANFAGSILETASGGAVKKLFGEKISNAMRGGFEVFSKKLSEELKKPTAKGVVTDALVGLAVDDAVTSIMQFLGWDESKEYFVDGWQMAGHAYIEFAKDLLVTTLTSAANAAIGGSSPATIQARFQIGLTVGVTQISLDKSIELYRVASDLSGIQKKNIVDIAAGVGGVAIEYIRAEKKLESGKGGGAELVEALSRSGIYASALLNVIGKQDPSEPELVSAGKMVSSMADALNARLSGNLEGMNESITKVRSYANDIDGPWGRLKDAAPGFYSASYLVDQLLLATGINREN